MRAILLSIKPKWVEKILNGEKTIEVRKIAPKIREPFKVYIYCSKAKRFNERVIGNNVFSSHYLDERNGKVVAEFICDNKYNLSENHLTPTGLEHTCLTESELKSYLGYKYGYALHISQLEIYDKPKELSEFRVRKYLYKYTHDCWDTLPVKKPPQNYMFVEDLGVEND